MKKCNIKDKTIKFVVEKWCDEYKQLFKEFMYDRDIILESKIPSNNLNIMRKEVIPKLLYIQVEERYYNKDMELIETRKIY